MERNDRLSHAYIIAATPEDGWKRARELAKQMVCSGPSAPCSMCRDCQKAEKGVHPDIIVTERLDDGKGKQKREILVDQVRQIQDSSAILPNEAQRKVYIIKDAGTMNANAQNALLKLLEEPPAFVAFILITDGADQLLETVRSRCVTETINGGLAEPPAKARELAEKYLAATAKHNPVAVLSLLNVNNGISVQEASEFAAATSNMLADMLCRRLSPMGMERRELMRLAKLMDRMQEYFKFNVSVKHAFGMLAAETTNTK